jgi:hypothetical protein
MNYTEAVVQKFERLRARLAAVEAERDAAQAGEARAVEALEAEQRAAHWRITDKHEDALEAGRLSEIAQRLRHGIVLVLTNNQPALDWLAQREREAAAAEALEDIAKESGTDGGKAYFASVVYREFPDRLTMRIGVVEAGELIMRAAALRAGATGGADAG